MKKLFIIIPIIVLAVIGYTQIQNNNQSDPSVSQNESVNTNIGDVTAKETSDYLGSYTITEEAFGTNVTVTVDGDTRTIVSNAIPNHDTGTFPNDGNPNTITEQEKTWEFPINPVWTGDMTWARETGVSINGVKIEPETNERITCTTGEIYRIEAKQDNYDLGLDFNNAHVQPTGEYHYHGVSQAMVDAFDQGEDLIHVGFAADGYLIYYSKSGAYNSSYQLSTDKRTGESCTYTARETKDVIIGGTTPDGTYVSDWEYIDGLGDLDECNGTTINGQYIYLMTDDYPFSGRCLNGEVEGEGRPGGQGGPGRQGGESPPVNNEGANENQPEVQSADQNEGNFVIIDGEGRPEGATGDRPQRGQGDRPTREEGDRPTGPPPQR